MSIRTTLTLDEDVFERVKARAADTQRPFRETVNETTAASPGQPGRVRPHVHRRGPSDRAQAGTQPQQTTPVAGRTGRWQVPVIIVDANLLIYAYDSTTPQYPQARQWLESTLRGPQTIGLPWISIWAFPRVTTNRRASAQPLTAAQAFAIVERWLHLPNVLPLSPTTAHLAILTELAMERNIVGSNLTDATLAALTIEHGATLASADSDFGQFVPRLKWVNPLWTTALTQ